MVGVILFTGFIIAIIIPIKNKDKKFMFLFLILCAFFQVYMRDFVFLCYLIYLSADNKKENEYSLSQACQQ